MNQGYANQNLLRFSISVLGTTLTFIMFGVAAFLMGRALRKFWKKLNLMEEEKRNETIMWIHLVLFVLLIVMGGLLVVTYVI